MNRNRKTKPPTYYHKISNDYYYKHIMSSNGGDNGQQCGGSGDMASSKNECISCDQNDNIDNITKGIDNVALLSDTSSCASCGKEGNSDDMNTCNKCRMVKYCNAACKKKHRSKHKKACERRIAELHDEKLFKDSPPLEECPICMEPLPINNQSMFKSCCGKIICCGCIYTMKMSEGKDICAFCRTPDARSDEGNLNRTKKLMNRGNGDACYQLAGCYANGDLGLQQDYREANKLYLKGGELGCADAYHNLGVHYNNYDNGLGVGIDQEKAKHYYELAAMGGNEA